MLVLSFGDTISSGFPCQMSHHGSGRGIGNRLGWYNDLEPSAPCLLPMRLPSGDEPETLPHSVYRAVLPPTLNTSETSSCVLPCPHQSPSSRTVFVHTGQLKRHILNHRGSLFQIYTEMLLPDVKPFNPIVLQHFVYH